MKKNIGLKGRVIRMLAGLGIISLAFVGPHSHWAFLGLIPLAIGLVGWCPRCAFLGISTCKNCK